MRPTSAPKFLIVQRPSDDKYLPDVWGIPAGSVKDNETFEEAVVRSGKEKLGVGLKVTRFIGRDDIERSEYVLHMEEYEAEITQGNPKVPQPIQGITQYQKYAWGDSSNIKEAATKGSLCSQIYLRRVNEKW
jgi:ADP-ribose pyrophosphatase YjhB (NUDIX family)